MAAARENKAQVPGSGTATTKSSIANMPVGNGARAVNECLVAASRLCAFALKQSIFIRDHDIGMFAHDRMVVLVCKKRSNSMPGTRTS